MAHIARLAQCESAKGAAPAHISGDVMAEATPKAAGGAVRAFDARARKQFLDHLAMTANVAASSRKAGVTSQTAYAYRRRHPEFAALWQAALSEGFGKLEQDLLAEALNRSFGQNIGRDIERPCPKASAGAGAAITPPRHGAWPAQASARAGGGTGPCRESGRQNSRYARPDAGA